MHDAAVKLHNQSRLGGFNMKFQPTCSYTKCLSHAMWHDASSCVVWYLDSTTDIMSHDGIMTFHDCEPFDLGELQNTECLAFL